MSKVQILLSTYNGEKYLKEQIDSILSQTHKDIDLLVRDDGSTDTTVQILEYYSKKGLLVYYVGENLGFCGSFFDLIKNANEEADFFAFADQDDYWLPQKIEVALHYLEKSKLNLPTMYCSATTITDENLKIIKNHNNKKIKNLSFGNSMIENIATGCTIVFNKNLLFELKKVESSKNIFIHDWFCYMICASMGKIFYDKNSYIFYRQHSTNSIGSSKNIIQEQIKRFKTTLKYLKQNIIYKNIEAFYTTYKDCISKEDLILLNKYLDNSFKSRFNLIIKNNIYRQQKFVDVIIKFFILFKFI